MQVKLTNNSWHRKLQEWIFGENVIRFGSLCPYFWFTIFCLIAIPFICIFKTLSKIFKLTMNFIEKNIFEPIERKQAKELTHEQLISLYINIYKNEDFNWSKRDKLISKLFKLTQIKYGWKKLDWWEFEKKALNKHRSEKEKLFKEQELQARLKPIQFSDVQKQRRDKLDKLVQKIVAITRIVAPIFLIVTTLYLGYLLVSFLMSIDMVIWLKIGEVAMIILAVAVVLCLIIFALMILSKLSIFGNLGDKVKDSLGNNISKLFKKVASVFGIFIDYAKAFKQDYCPLIDWEEKE